MDTSRFSRHNISIWHKKKKFIFLILIGLLGFCFHLIDRIYYSDSVDFLSPLDLPRLEIRKDSYGDGHFGSKRKRGFHKGIDIVAPVRSPVRAVKGGWSLSGFDKDGYGKYVKIYHPGNLVTIYAHLDEVNIGWVKRVRQGDVIGWVGKTGNSRYKDIKPHLHFEIRKNGIPINPQELETWKNRL